MDPAGGGPWPEANSAALPQNQAGRGRQAASALARQRLRGRFLPTAMGRKGQERLKADVPLNVGCGRPAGSEAMAAVPPSPSALMAAAHAAGTPEPVRALLATAVSREQEAPRNAAVWQETGAGSGRGW